MEEELIALLVTNAGVSARLSQRVYFGRKPQAEAATHYAVLNVISLDRSYDMQGNKCQDCRACWDASVSNVSYHQH